MANLIEPAIEKLAKSLDINHRHAEVIVAAVVVHLTTALKAKQHIELLFDGRSGGFLEFSKYAEQLRDLPPGQGFSLALNDWHAGKETRDNSLEHLKEVEIALSQFLLRHPELLSDPDMEVVSRHVAEEAAPKILALLLHSTLAFILALDQEPPPALIKAVETHQNED